MEHFATKAARYESLARRLSSLLDGERDCIANAANTSALLYELLPDLNWVGFYFRRGEDLVLGPFQGRAACVRIGWGRGVCGSAAQRRESLVVANVHQFDGHIACDAASNAELVVPLLVGEEVVAVLDLDSPSIGRFDEEDRVGVESLTRIYLDASDLTPFLGVRP